MDRGRIPETMYINNYDEGFTEEIRRDCVLFFFEAGILCRGTDHVSIFRDLAWLVKDNKYARR